MSTTQAAMARPVFEDHEKQGLALHRKMRDGAPLSRADYVSSRIQSALGYAMACELFEAGKIQNGERDEGVIEAICGMIWSLHMNNVANHGTVTAGEILERIIADVGERLQALQQHGMRAESAGYMEAQAGGRA